MREGVAEEGLFPKEKEGANDSGGGSKKGGAEDDKTRVVGLEKKSLNQGVEKFRRGDDMEISDRHFEGRERRLRGG